MSTFVTMTSTVDDLTNGDLVRVRTRTAIQLIAQNKATLSPLRQSTSVKNGKRANV